MSKLLLSIGAVQPNWIRHNVPWLSVLALVFGLSRDDYDTRDNADNG